MRKRERLARFGIGTKGFVYSMLGGLTAMAALGQGGKQTGQSGVLDYLSNQPYGNSLLWITAIGLFAFALWRLYRAFLEQHDDDSQGKEVIRRVAYGLSAFFYGSLGYSAINIARNRGDAGGKTWAEDILALSYGKWLLLLVGLIILGKAGYEIYRAYTNEYKEKLERSQISSDLRELLLKTGKIGHTARGVVIGIIAYITIKGALSQGGADSAGTVTAFSFLEGNFGTLALGFIAAGLFCYGIFQLVRARYEPLAI